MACLCKRELSAKKRKVDFIMFIMDPVDLISLIISFIYTRKSRPRPEPFLDGLQRPLCLVPCGRETRLLLLFELKKNLLGMGLPPFRISFSLCSCHFRIMTLVSVIPFSCRSSNIVFLLRLSSSAPSALPFGWGEILGYKHIPEG